MGRFHERTGLMTVVRSARKNGVNGASSACLCRNRQQSPSRSMEIGEIPMNRQFMLPWLPLTTRNRTNRWSEEFSVNNWISQLCFRAVSWGETCFGLCPCRDRMLNRKGKGKKASKHLASIIFVLFARLLYGHFFFANPVHLASNVAYLRK